MLRKITSKHTIVQNNNTHRRVIFSPVKHIYENTRVTNTHSRLSELFDRFVLNRLVSWFSHNGKVTEFVRKERQRRSLEDNVIITSKVYGSDDNNSTLFLQISKNGTRLIHLSIHLAPKYIDNDHSSSGFVHIVKDVYKNYGIQSYKECLIKTMYVIIQPEEKPHSLYFIPYLRKCTYQQLSKITMKQKHNKATLIQAIDTHEYDVQQEMDVITAVLNKMFDEDDPEHYVGDYNALHPRNPIQVDEPIHPNTNTVLHNINQRPNFIRRKNRGVYFSDGGRRTCKRK